MFWGLTLESGKHYSQSVEDSFHVSMAALELEGEIKEGKLSPHLRVMVQHQKKEFLICSLLQNGFLIQQQLDLDFTEGEEVTFYLEGNGVVHLTGYLVQEKPFKAEEEPILGSPPDSSEDGMAVSGDESEDAQAEKLPTLQDLAKSDDLSSDDEDEDDWIPEENAKCNLKRKLDRKPAPKQQKKNKKIKIKTEEASEDSDGKDSLSDGEDTTKELTDLFNDIEATAEAENKQNQHTTTTTMDASAVEKDEGTEGAGDASQKKRKKKNKKKQQQENGTTEAKAASSPVKETQKPKVIDAESHTSPSETASLRKLASAIALFPGKAVTKRSFRCSGPRPLRLTPSGDFLAALEYLQEFGRTIQVQVPRHPHPIVVYLKYAPGDVRQAAWNPLISEERFQEQYSKKTHSKISNGLRDACTSYAGLPGDHFDYAPMAPLPCPARTSGNYFVSPTEQSFQLGTGDQRGGTGYVAREEILENTPTSSGQRIGWSSREGTHENTFSGQRQGSLKEEELSLSESQAADSAVQALQSLSDKCSRMIRREGEVTGVVRGVRDGTRTSQGEEGWTEDEDEVVAVCGLPEDQSID